MALTGIFFISGCAGGVACSPDLVTMIPAPITPADETRFHWLCASEHGRRCLRVITHDGWQTLRHLRSCAGAGLRSILAKFIK